jgi:hypothetical protein
MSSYIHLHKRRYSAFSVKSIDCFIEIKWKDSPFKKIKMESKLIITKLFLLLFLTLVYCSKPDLTKPIVKTLPTLTEVPPVSSLNWTNDSHLKRLFKLVRMANGADVGAVGIYADYPSYQIVTAPGEGFACVDDVSRAALFYLNEVDISTNIEKQNRLSRLTEFVLQLQADSGYFYNFLKDDLTINKTFGTSIDRPDWWSWRALWHLSEVYPFYKKNDAALANRIKLSIQKVVLNIKRDLGNLSTDTEIINGIVVPKWLPGGSATDQSAIIMLGLYNVYAESQDNEILKILNQLANGIMLMRKGNATQFPYAVFMSYENKWHAYGSDQAYALLKIGKALNKQNWIDAAQQEVDYFYPYLLNKGFLESFEIQQTGSNIELVKKSTFAQISYGIRPMIWATIELYKITNDPKYLTEAGQILAWYVGNNPANQKIYEKVSGICFDGISSSTNINKNSGAESTIEALWAFQLAEKYPEILVESKKYN